MLLDQGGEQLSQINFTGALASTLLETVEDRSEVHVQLEAPVTEEPNMRMNVDSDESMRWTRRHKRKSSMLHFQFQMLRPIMKNLLYFQYRTLKP